jgi:hypothetical protein
MDALDYDGNVSNYHPDAFGRGTNAAFPVEKPPTVMWTPPTAFQTTWTAMRTPPAAIRTVATPMRTAPTTVWTPPIAL